MGISKVQEMHSSGYDFIIFAKTQVFHLDLWKKENMENRQKWHGCSYYRQLMLRGRVQIGGESIGVSEFGRSYGPIATCTHTLYLNVSSREKGRLSQRAVGLSLSKIFPFYFHAGLGRTYFLVHHGDLSRHQTRNIEVRAPQWRWKKSFSRNRQSFFSFPLIPCIFACGLPRV